MAGTSLEIGSVVEALVLDVAKAERLVDLTLKPEFINRSKERSSISHSSKKVEHFFVPFSHLCSTLHRKSLGKILMHI